MASTVLHGMGAAAGWRTHRVLEESDDADSPSPVPDRFRKRPSSSSLNSLRMSLRKRLPLRAVPPNTAETPGRDCQPGGHKPGAVRGLTRSARNSIGGVYQKIQRSRLPREECLVATPGKSAACEGLAVRTPRKTGPRAAAVTPKSASRRTPRSGAKKTPRAARTPEPGGSSRAAGRAGGSRRKLIRMAALRSPFASPKTQGCRRQFDQDLESVSTGLRRLKRLSQAFDDMIGKDERTQAIENYCSVMVQSYSSTRKTSRATIRRKTARIRETVNSWTDVALSSIRKGN
nr:PREDICTED: uncharacterized protein LOC102692515 isoform X1 [Lepisosteus oculatus]